jgi:hypothetical protein
VLAACRAGGACRKLQTGGVTGQNGAPTNFAVGEGGARGLSRVSLLTRMGAGDASTEASGTQPGAGDTPAGESGTRREDG